jgi:hypothetical protein
VRLWRLSPERTRCSQVELVPFAICAGALHLVGEVARAPSMVGLRHFLRRRPAVRRHRRTFRVRAGPSVRDPPDRITHHLYGSLLPNGESSTLSLCLSKRDLSLRSLSLLSALSVLSYLNLSLSLSYAIRSYLIILSLILSSYLLSYLILSYSILSYLIL